MSNNARVDDKDVQCMHAEITRIENRRKRMVVVAKCEDCEYEGLAENK
jgi:hypothetical protein